MPTVQHRNNRGFTISGTFFEVNSKYEPGEEIGNGACGVVCSSINTETNEKVAIKKISNVVSDSRRALNALREIRILRHVRHTNVISLKDVMVPSPKCEDLYMVFEFMDCDLMYLLFSSDFLSTRTVKHLMFQLLNGVNYLHRANIIHRDLKPENLLLNANCDLKICDFGAAITTKGGSRESQSHPLKDAFHVGTLRYKAPEILLECDTHGPAVDVWSIGCIFGELLGRKPAMFPGTDTLSQIYEIVDILGTPDKVDNSTMGFVTSPIAREILESRGYTRRIEFKSLFPTASDLELDLLSKLLQFDPRKRITVSDALQHPYFDNKYDIHYGYGASASASAEAPYPCEFGVDDKIGVDKLKDMIWDERLLLYR